MKNGNLKFYDMNTYTVDKGEFFKHKKHLNGRCFWAREGDKILLKPVGEQARRYIEKNLA